MRTTLDIDKTILEEVKRLRKRRGGSLGKVVSSLLAESLKHEPLKTSKDDSNFNWQASAMNPRVDLSDKEAVYQILDRS